MLQTITQGKIWSEEYTKLNQMFGELSVYAGVSYIPIWDDWWVNIFQDLNHNFEVLYDALDGEGRQVFLFEESWGSVRGKMNTMFAYLYDLMGSDVTFEVSENPPMEGVSIDVNHYVNYVSTTVTDIYPSTVTFSSNYFTIPLDVTAFTFKDDGVDMSATYVTNQWIFEAV